MRRGRGRSTHATLFLFRPLIADACERIRRRRRRIFFRERDSLSRRLKFIRLHNSLNHTRRLGGGGNHVHTIHPFSPLSLPSAASPPPRCSSCGEQRRIFYLRSWRPHWQFAAALCKCSVTYARRAAFSPPLEKNGRRRGWWEKIERRK